MRLGALAFVFVLALAPMALADTPPSVWDRARDPAVGKSWDLHLLVQGYFAAADAAISAQRRSRVSDVDVAKPWFERARNVLEDAHASESSDVRLRFDYGICLQRLHENAKAFTVLADALAMAPTHPMAIGGGHPGWLTYSIVSAYLENSEEERRGYEKFLAYATESDDRLTPMLNLAEAEMHLGNLGESQRGYATVLQTAASLPNEMSMESAILATWGLAVAQDRAGDFGAAARTAESAISMDPPPESDRDPFFASSHLPASYSVMPTIATHRAIILDETNVFFVPPYERKWYLALGETALARRDADPRHQLFHWRAVEKFWNDYVTGARKHKPPDRYVATAEKRLDAATKKREELEKRVGSKAALPSPSRQIFIE